MEAHWLPTVPNMFVYIPHWHHIVRNCTWDVVVDQVYKGLLSLHLTLWLLSNVLHKQGFSSAVCQAVVSVTKASTTKVTTGFGRYGQVGMLEKCTK